MLKIKVMGMKCLFFNKRMKENQIPEGYFAYQLRHGDNWGIPEYIEKYVGCNFYGTLLMPQLIDFKDSDFLKINKRDKENFVRL